MVKVMMIRGVPVKNPPLVSDSPSTRGGILSRRSTRGGILSRRKSQNFSRAFGARWDYIVICVYNTCCGNLLRRRRKFFEIGGDLHCENAFSVRKTWCNLKNFRLRRRLGSI